MNVLGHPLFWFLFVATIAVVVTRILGSQLSPEARERRKRRRNYGRILARSDRGSVVLQARIPKS